MGWFCNKKSDERIKELEKNLEFYKEVAEDASNGYRGCLDKIDIMYNQHEALKKECRYEVIQNIIEENKKLKSDNARLLVDNHCLKESLKSSQQESRKQNSKNTMPPSITINASPVAGGIDIKEKEERDEE